MLSFFALQSRILHILFRHLRSTDFLYSLAYIQLFRQDSIGLCSFSIRIRQSWLLSHISSRCNATHKSVLSTSHAPIPAGILLCHGTYSILQRREAHSGAPRRSLDHSSSLPVLPGASSGFHHPLGRSISSDWTACK